MKLAIYDPKPTVNDYVEQRWLQPLVQFCRDSGITVKEIPDPIPEFGWTMLCNAHHLNATLVQHFDANRCPIVGISCNDSAYLTECIRPFFDRLPLLFTISGVQKVNSSKQTYVAEGMQFKTRDVQYLPDEEWRRYHHMYLTGRLLPLPYVPWDRLPDVPIPEQKTPKILFRGGNHFWRFVAYLHALKAGVAHPASGFLCQDYFWESMVPQFRYCEKCRAEWNANGQRLSYDSLYSGCMCSMHEMGHERDVYVRTSELEQPLGWNNRTPRAFFSLAHTFSISRDGCLPQADVEQALNFRRQSAEHHLRAVADAAFFAECKWEFSIPFPQRAWEAASVNTVNLAPERAADQDYFPRWEPNEHHAVYSNDFSDIHHWVDQERLEQIADNARQVYEQWIRPDRYVTNSRLLEHIVQRIAEVSE